MCAVEPRRRPVCPIGERTGTRTRPSSSNPPWRPKRISPRSAASSPVSGWCRTWRLRLRSGRAVPDPTRDPRAAPGAAADGDQPAPIGGDTAPVPAGPGARAELVVPPPDPRSHPGRTHRPGRRGAEPGPIAAAPPCRSIGCCPRTGSFTRWRPRNPTSATRLLARQSADLATAAIFRIPSYVDSLDRQRPPSRLPRHEGSDPADAGRPTTPPLGPAHPGPPVRTGRDLRALPRRLCRAGPPRPRGHDLVVLQPRRHRPTLQLDPRRSGRARSAVVRALGRWLRSGDGRSGPGSRDRDGHRRALRGADRRHPTTWSTGSSTRSPPMPPDRAATWSSSGSTPAARVAATPTSRSGSGSIPTRCGSGSPATSSGST